jgi:N-acetylglucosamine-6-phosphate deacetylase
MTLIHSARKLDAHGEVDSFWMLTDGDTIVGTGHGAPPEAATAIAEQVVAAAGRWLVPGFIDLHGHGGGGFSFDGADDAIPSALATHRRHGTTRSVLSLVAAPLAELRASLSRIADLAHDDPLVLGSHLEGPFLAPARRGAHDPEALREPSPDAVEELIGAARGTLRQLTLAPELPGAFEAIDVLVEAGVVVAVGHTEADLALTRAAFDRGARLLTHAFNAMPGIHHRAPGPVVAAFGDERVTLELVLDGEHVHPQIAALAFQSAPGRIALVTDAMAAAGAGDGDYRLGGLDVTVANGRAVLSDTAPRGAGPGNPDLSGTGLDGAGTLAGSTLTQDAALRCAIERAGIPAVTAIGALTLTPARALGLEHRHGLLAPGFAADAVLLDHAWHVTDVWAAGARVR